MDSTPLMMFTQRRLPALDQGIRDAPRASSVELAVVKTIILSVIRKISLGYKTISTWMIPGIEMILCPFAPH